MAEDHSLKLERHEARLGHHETRIENLEHDLYGNGREGIKTDMAILRRDLKRAQADMLEILKRDASRLKSDVSSNKLMLGVVGLLSAGVAGFFQLLLELVK